MTLRYLVQPLWLLLLWLMLWGSVSAVVLIGGLAVVIAVRAAFRMPAVDLRVTLRPLRLIGLFWHLLIQLVSSATSVAWAAIRHGGHVPAAVMEVPLEEDSDVIIAATVFFTAMSPGSLVLEIDRERRVLYVHGLPAGTRAEAERRRRSVRQAERATVSALKEAPKEAPK
ncbi:Na+/H+ antiporter subunit E [Streptomyces sp. MP131-18]|uniref:Na+/H+ antiporter subunit E n=1 Tax=Streptomyces sp. MP131-18 TaxID=1857892 RepID=UPI0009A1EE9B|nr:Na+/H+ antiporter subunit E [Streptomyces sp. MP131-18]ONK11855.1 putative monovalent cation/H+ antiporter subunitE [Streptomyces sp. MP131-18]